MVLRPAMAATALGSLCALCLTGFLWPASVVLSSSSGQLPAEADGLPTVLVSRQLRESQGLSVGDLISLSNDPAGAHPRRFRIAGEYEPVPDPMRLGAANNEVRLHLPDLIEMTSNAADPLARESVDAINVALGDPSDPAGFARDLSGRIP